MKSGLIFVKTNKQQQQQQKDIKRGIQDSTEEEQRISVKSLSEDKIRSIKKLEGERLQCSNLHF